MCLCRRVCMSAVTARHVMLCSPDLMSSWWAQIRAVLQIQAVRTRCKCHQRERERERSRQKKEKQTRRKDDWTAHGCRQSQFFPQWGAEENLMVRHTFPRLLSSYSSFLESGESILTVSICCKEFRFTKFLTKNITKVMKVCLFYLKQLLFTLSVNSN